MNGKLVQWGKKTATISRSTASTIAVTLSKSYSNTTYQISLTLCHLGYAGYINEVVRKDTETTSGFSVDIENRITDSSGSTSFDFYFRTEGFI